jgi:hypothetical protein
MLSFNKEFKNNSNKKTNVNVKSKEFKKAKADTGRRLN